VEPHYVNPKIAQTSTPKTDAAVQIASKMMNVSPDKVLTKLAGKHVNLPDLERKDVANANSPDPKFTGPLIRGHSALGLEYTPGDVRGYIQHVKVAHDYGKNVQKPNSFTISSTEMDSGGTTAEVDPQTQAPIATVIIIPIQLGTGWGIFNKSTDQIFLQSSHRNLCICIVPCVFICIPYLTTCFELHREHI
jgi:hypothetical protein